jgi:hypothetical protein
VSIIVLLDDADCTLALELAWQRQTRKEDRPSTRKFRKAVSETSLDGHCIGVKGEIAVAAYMGWKVDSEERDSGDNGADFVIQGVTFDCQTTTYNPPHLKYDEKHPFRAQVAILVRAATDREMNIVGWITRKEFESVAVMRDYGHGARRSVGPEAMLPMPTLKERLKRWLEGSQQ